MTVKERLQIFVDNGVPLNQIAKRAEIHYTTLSKWLSGIRSISPDLENKINDALYSFYEVLKGTF